MIQVLATLPERRGAWLLLAVSAIGLILVAMYFQHGMDLQPCVKCIYQRTAVLAIALACFPALLVPQFLVTRLLSLLGWMSAAIWGLSVAWDHHNLQNSKNAFFAVCEGAPNFPDWLPLLEWFPSFFKAPGLCGDIDWQFLGLGMPGWMLVIFTFYTALAGAVILSRLIRLHRI